MMMPLRLTVIGDLERPDHRYIPPDAQCYFWGEYTPYEHTQGKRWDYSPTNRLITNFKKGLEHQGRLGWQYKQQAIQQVAQAFAGFWKWAEIHQNYRLALIPVPPSKARGNPMYDARMLAMLQQLAHHADVALDIRDCLSFSGVHAASHEGPQRPSPDELYAALNFDPASGRQHEPPGVLFVFDDMLTTGAHYVAVTSKLAEVYPGAQMVGHFIARRIIPHPFAGP
ncbi:hypothetical protein [Corticimicrobacter populi]|uniref:Phosphoribosyltransferase n=1 Tax=Corticimicrobacter populi TaxID=2175229 RepID=A0A2V1K1V0_9BURK|nr:hypothetical protein [Corticimicrobacter populi]PWF23215.1 hypothetical protein DD235_09510 [Corticimicrobacter populi]